MTQDKMRAEFEVWAAGESLPIDRYEVVTQEYGYFSTQCAWKVWQAAQKREPLSDEQLSKALEAGCIGTQTHIGILNRVSWTTCGSIDPRKICRAIEAAHNITKE